MTLYSFETIVRLPEVDPPQSVTNNGIARVGWMNDVNEPPTVGLFIEFIMGTEEFDDNNDYGRLACLGAVGGDVFGSHFLMDKYAGDEPFAQWVRLRVEYDSVAKTAKLYLMGTNTPPFLHTTKTNVYWTDEDVMGLGFQVFKLQGEATYAPKLHVDLITTTAPLPDGRFDALPGLPGATPVPFWGFGYDEILAASNGSVAVLVGNELANLAGGFFTAESPDPVFGPRVVAYSSGVVTLGSTVVDDPPTWLKASLPRGGSATVTIVAKIGIYDGSSPFAVVSNSGDADLELDVLGPSGPGAVNLRGAGGGPIYADIGASVFVWRCKASGGSTFTVLGAGPSSVSRPTTNFATSDWGAGAINPAGAGRSAPIAVSGIFAFNTNLSDAQVLAVIAERCS